MITLDGPAADTFMVKRAPIWLRAVVDTVSGKKDVLNELEDKPSVTEKIYVYKRQGEASTVHLLMSPRSKSGFYAMATYKYQPGIDGEALRETDAWQKWVTEHVDFKVDMKTGLEVPEIQHDDPDEVHKQIQE